MNKNIERLQSLKRLIDRLNMNDFEREHAYKNIRELEMFFKKFEKFIEDNKK